MKSTCVVKCENSGGVYPFNSPQTCNDGNTVTGDGCNNCQEEAGWTCTEAALNAQSTCVNSCGDGDVDSGENCDDGNIANNDGCSSTCQVEIGWGCTNVAANTPDSACS